MDFAWKQVHMLRASGRPDYVIVSAWGREFRITPTEAESRDVAVGNRLSDVTVEFVHLRFSLDPAPALDKACGVAGADSSNAASEGAGAATEVIDRVDKSDDEITLVVPGDDLAEIVPAPTIRARSARRGA